MPAGSTYVGRHRGRHRAIPEQRTRGLTLPGAAAAALTITATGAAVLPGLGGASASATEGHRPTTEPSHEQQAAATTGVAASLRDRDLVARAQRARERASRDHARQQIIERREAALARAHRWVLPVTHYRFTSTFGTRWGRLHAGDDLAAPVGTRIGSLSSGTVIFAGTESGYGNKVEVRHWDGTVSWYGHMSSIAVKVGDKVAPGDKLGEVGNTGHSTGPHLHLEIHPGGGVAVNPAAWLAKHGLHL
ncbi:MAG TPA: M23 family metallopeptidase [Actinomycetales bacterium]|nr:M23 family metallopeptidase [Actinomycetales bacterium]